MVLVLPEITIVEKPVSVATWYIYQLIPIQASVDPDHKRSTVPVVSVVPLAGEISVTWVGAVAS